MYGFTSKMLSGSQTKRFGISSKDIVAFHLTSSFDIYGELNVWISVLFIVVYLSIFIVAMNLFIDIYCSNESKPVDFNANLGQSGTVEV